jgi:hypothetical protein
MGGETTTDNNVKGQEQPGAKPKAAMADDPQGNAASFGPSAALRGNAFSEASRVVHKAASILEEEIAAGISAARQIEERFINVGELRLGKPDDLMQRIRRDAHEIVDILIDLFGAAAKSINGATQRIISVGNTATSDRGGKGEGAPSRRAPVLDVLQPVKPGGKTEVSMSVENDADMPTKEFRFQSTELLDAAGHRIGAEHIHFIPPLLAIGPRLVAKVDVVVAVPSETLPGAYSGLIQATELEQVRAVLIIHVE